MDIKIIDSYGNKYISSHSFETKKKIMEILTTNTNKYCSKTQIYDIMTTIRKEYFDTMFHAKRELGIFNHSDYEKIIRQLNENEDYECFDDNFYRYIGEYSICKKTLDIIYEKMCVLRNNNGNKQYYVAYNNENIVIVLM